LILSSTFHYFFATTAQRTVRTRDRPIYRPIFGFYRYIGIDLIGVDKTLL